MSNNPARRQRRHQTRREVVNQAVQPQVQPVAQIIIDLLPNGSVNMQAVAPSPILILGMIETAKMQVFEKMKQSTSDTAHPTIEVAPPGMHVARNGKAG